MNEKEALLLLSQRFKDALDEFCKNISIDVQAETPKPKTIPLPATEETAKHFPEDLRQLLTFELKEGWILIRPVQFLGSDNFSKIAGIVRGLDGEYVSYGKASHFRVPVKEAT
jgi:hypothetical protein